MSKAPPLPSQESDFEPPDPFGWICPVCECGVAPWMDVCPCNVPVMMLKVTDGKVQCTCAACAGKPGKNAPPPNGLN